MGYNCVLFVFRMVGACARRGMDNELELQLVGFVSFAVGGGDVLLTA